jgi:hypothetical protein
MSHQTSLVFSVIPKSDINTNIIVCTGSRIFAQLLQFVNSPNAASKAGFALGFTYTFKDKNIISHPLSTIYNSCIAGIIYAYCALYVHAFVPKQFKFIVPLASLVSSYYYANKDRSIKKRQ